MANGGTVTQSAEADASTGRFKETTEGTRLAFLYIDKSNLRGTFAFRVLVAVELYINRPGAPTRCEITLRHCFRVPRGQEAPEHAFRAYHFIFQNVSGVARIALMR